MSVRSMPDLRDSCPIDVSDMAVIVIVMAKLFNVIVVIIINVIEFLLLV